MARRAPCIVIHARLVCLALAITACVSAGLESPARSTGASEAHLTASEIGKFRYDNAYDAVRNLRPMFLKSRGPTSLLEAPVHDILVIVNGQVHGGIDELRAIQAAEVKLVRRLTASEVYYKLGRSAPSGGIEVWTAP